MASAKPVRFWRASRTITILLLLLALGLTLLSNIREDVPNSIMRRFFYPVHHASSISDSAERAGIDPLLVCSVIRSESSWDEHALSAAGAVGLMQILPSTAEEIASLGLVDAQSFDLADLGNPQVNIEYGTAYLAYLYRYFGNLEQAIAAYNAGMGVVSSWSSQDYVNFEDAIEYAETRNYLESVQNSYAEYQRLYPNGIQVVAH